ncbi:hypothetical protein U27_06192 [Candidatus Vecturithrix granuli]|uniref:Uncharacterized protein n=1 Tax=Vecturithrix granuli TaxID=1499967 RepID=A0A081C3R0_VECG1|nr:hypothetical protein U27_06192 [Candidatus Vecturithrix granuli]
MKTQSVDTHPKAEEVQLNLLRKAGPIKRAWLMRSLSQTVLRLSRRTLREMNPDLSEQALNVLFVRYCYGDDLADRLQIYLNRGKEHGIA